MPCTAVTLKQSSSLSVQTAAAPLKSWNATLSHSLTILHQDKATVVLAVSRFRPARNLPSLWKMHK